jgi:serine/threonine-protein kinase RsbW
MIETFAKTAKDEVIELSFPAQGDLITLARFTAATVATRAGFDVEEIEDLRLAVDELCVSFGPLTGDRLLRIEFRRLDEVVAVECVLDPPPSGSPGSEGTPAEDGASTVFELSEQLLDALVDAHGRESVGGMQCAWLRKRRGSAQR